MRRAISTRTRPVAPLLRRAWRIRTLHPPRRVVRDGVREPFTLDGIVTVTLPHLLWLDRVRA